MPKSSKSEAEPGAPSTPPERSSSSQLPSARPPPMHRAPSASGSWLERLEEARREVSGVPAPRSATVPPPLKSSRFVRKPAHLLVSELEAKDEAEPSEPDTRDLIESERGEQEIAMVSLDLPTQPERRRRIPDWVVAVVLILLVLGGVGYFALQAREEPAPVAEVDPRLLEELKRQKEAMRQLEAGHALVQSGKSALPKAIAAYQKALKLDPKLADAERGLGIAYAGQDQPKEAVKHYRRYLKLNPKAKDAKDVRKIVEGYEKTKGK